MKTLRQLVAGTDFSEGAHAALALAVELAHAAGARLTLVHVCEPGAEGLDDDTARACGASLERLVAQYQRRRVALAPVLRHGSPWTKLDNVAAEVGARVIVVGRHGSGRGHVVPPGAAVAPGSVAAHLVRSASRPVLVVPPDLECLDSEASALIHRCHKESNR